MTKREIKVDLLGVITSALRGGNFNGALKDGLSNSDRELAIQVENELADELIKRYKLNP